MPLLDGSCNRSLRYEADDRRASADGREANDRKPGKCRYDFLHPVDLDATRLRDPFLYDLATSATFRRLASVRFLGALDYVFVPSPNGALRNKRHTRHGHSLGVMHLATVFADRVDLEERTRRPVLAAALLHDIGHAPFSHTLESFFEKNFHINHHKATLDVVTGAAHTDGEIPRVLEAHGIDPAEVAAILAGERDPTGGFFSGPINFDTIEAILRSCTYLPKPRYIPNPVGVVTAAIDRASEDDREIVDQFWQLKDIVYKNLIQSDLGLVADEVFRCIADRRVDSLSPRDFLSNEASLFRKLPELRRTKWAQHHHELVEQLTEPCFSFKKRAFFIDAQASFRARTDTARYRQTKEIRVFGAGTTFQHPLRHTESPDHDTFL